MWTGARAKTREDATRAMRDVGVESSSGTSLTTEPRADARTAAHDDDDARRD